MGTKEDKEQIEVLKNIFELQTQMSKNLSRILDLLVPTVKASAIEFYVTISGQRRKVVQMFIKTSEQLPLSISIVDMFGNPAKVDGAPVWALTDVDAATVEVAEDGMSAVVKPTGKAASLKVQVSADADLGEGVKTLLGELDLDIVSGEAVSISIVAGEPIPQDAKA